MQELKELFENYIPYNQQEQADRQLILQAFSSFLNLLTRENPIIHLCASPWIMSKDRKQVLLVYHRIYDSWGWSGGHCDGDANLWQVAQREGKEETGIEALQLADPTPLAIDVLRVPRHWKNDRFVSAHLHINVTYLFYGDPLAPLSHKEDEVKGAKWFPAAQIAKIVKEQEMLPVYEKLNNKASQIG